QGLDTGEASFETDAPDWADWDQKYLKYCRLGWEVEGILQGWATLAAVSTRHCYRGVCEVSIYVGTDWHGNGIGSSLMTRLIEASEKEEIWTLYSSIFPENSATRKLHISHGFREVGMRERIAQKDGHWRDTLILERRSQRVGH
ncbi:MAG: L-amino acid N-acyltransferase YncA, partial [Gammaproteobacteria bacterium]